MPVAPEFDTDELGGSALPLSPKIFFSEQASLSDKGMETEESAQMFF
ncbi:MAG: hypothetical protein ACI9OD_000750 [Limisphaerales bacterium]|jgi:hypothetical protein